MKLWQKNYNVNKEILDFCVGNDHVLDGELVGYDIRGSLAHAGMLKKIGVLTAAEFAKLKRCLNEIKSLNARGKFRITKDDEDCHTAIENYLTKRLGDTGKKIHTARSRNDQVLTAIRLYAKDKILEVKSAVIRLCETLVAFARKNEFVPMPGYTHTRKAMPSSVGLWTSAFAESLLDDLSLLKTAYWLNDQSPLGSAAGYGVALNIDRKFTAKWLGFGKIQNNVLYVQNSRGKFEAVILSALSQVMLDLNKMATDIILFSTEEFGYFTLPDAFCTGSSLMPNKKNPDVLELVRAKYSVVLACEFQMKMSLANLISGYNRDLQLTKGSLMRGFALTLSSVKVMSLVIAGMKVNRAKCEGAITAEMFATDEAVRLVKKGVPFRDAYREVASNLGKVGRPDLAKNIRQKTHIGATGNLGLGAIAGRLKTHKKW